MPIQRVTSGIIADGAIVATDIADGTVTGPKVATGAIAIEKLANTGDVKIQSISANTLSVYTSTTEKMRIDSSGRVGIGTSSPNDTLEVAGSDAYIRVNRTGNEPGISFRYSNSSTNRGDIAVTSAGAMYFTAGGSTERMRIDSSGRVTMPYQPCFHVRVNNAAYITTSPIPFSNAPINVGSHFNTSTYKFTAPIAGKYYFVLMLYVRLSGSGDVTSYVRVNDSNRQYLNYIIGSSTTEYNSITMPSIFNLSAGDTVDYTFTATNGAYYGGNPETNLFGWLLG